MKHLFLILIPVLACVAAAQTPDGISAPVSRTVTLTADEAAFTITIAATLDSTQQQVKQALQSAGLPNPTVVATGLGQASYPSGVAQILYSATATIAAGSAMDTAKLLETLRAHLPDPLQSLQYSVAFNPSQATIDAARQTADNSYVIMCQVGDNFFGNLPSIGRGQPGADDSQTPFIFRQKFAFHV